jgi:hypothetical protein
MRSNGKQSACVELVYMPRWLADRVYEEAQRVGCSRAQAIRQMLVLGLGGGSVQEVVGRQDTPNPNYGRK